VYIVSYFENIDKYIKYANIRINKQYIKITNKLTNINKTKKQEIMKKITILFILVAILLSRFANAQALFTPSSTLSLATGQMIEFERIDTIPTKAELKYNITSLQDSIDVKCVFSPNANLIPLYAGFTTHRVKANQTVIDTVITNLGNVFYAAMVFIDTVAGATDTTNFMLMTRQPVITAWTINGILNGYSSSYSFDPGNDTVSFKEELGTDSTFSFTSPVFNGDTMTINNLVTENHQYVNTTGTYYVRFIITNTNGESDTAWKAVTALQPASLPTMNALTPNPTATSIAISIVCDTYGYLDTNAVVYIRPTSSGVWSDSTHIEGSIQQVAGGQQVNVVFNGLSSNTSYTLGGSLTIFTNGVFYTGSMQTVVVSTLAPTPVFSLDVQTVTVASNVDVDLGFTNVPSTTSNVTVGYFQSGSFLQTQTLNGLSNSGITTVSLPVPPTSGTYYATAYGANSLGEIKYADTVAFTVSILQIEEYVNTHNLVSRFKVYDTLGRQIRFGTSNGKFPRFSEILPTNSYIIECRDKNDRVVYLNKKFVQ
jgi:hypothetical protein